MARMNEPISRAAGLPAGLQFEFDQVLPRVVILAPRAEQIAPGGGEAVAGRHKVNRQASVLQKVSKLISPVGMPEN